MFYSLFVCRQRPAAAEIAGGAARLSDTDRLIRVDLIRIRDAVEGSKRGNCSAKPQSNAAQGISGLNGVVLAPELPEFPEVFSGTLRVFPA